MDKYKKASYDVVLAMATETQSEAIKQYKALMLEINAPAECQSWTDEQIADFATDFILESWKTKQG